MYNRFSNKENILTNGDTKMTKKHLVNLARMIKDNSSTTVGRAGGIKHIINYNNFITELSVYCEQENNLFDEDRFRLACGQVCEVQE